MITRRALLTATAAGLGGVVLHDRLPGGHRQPVAGKHVTNLLWLPGTLRAAGLTVVEHPGWKTRGHGAPMRARAVLLHHDASAPGASPDVPGWLVAGYRSGTDGHYDAQVWVDRAGRWHMIAAGSAQHAGEGDGWGAIRPDRGNVDSFGVETDHTVGEAWPPAQMASIRTGLAAVCRATGWRPDSAVVGHREYAPARKVDPAGIDLRALRADLTRRVAA